MPRCKNLTCIANYYMRRFIIITIILLIATVAITTVYFKKLRTTGQNNSETMQAIPDNTALVFEFNNDNGFYDIFTDNKLFAAVVGKQQIDDLDTLRSQLLTNSPLQKFFNGQNIFISIHLHFISFFAKGKNGWLTTSYYMFTIGIVFFSGSLYLLACRDLLHIESKIIGPITPLGGLFFIIGWFSLAVAAARSK